MTAPPPRVTANEEGWVRLHPLSPLLRGGIAFLIIVGVIIANLRDRLIELFVGPAWGGDESGYGGDPIDMIVRNGWIIFALLALLVIVALIVLVAWLSWRFQTFRISADAVELRKGILFKQHRRAPLERIQSVNLERPFLARLVGLTLVDVQTAGQGGKVSLAYLSHAQAKQVREQILGRASAAQSEAGVTEPLLETRVREFVDPDVEQDAQQQGSLITVPPGRLLASILLGWDVIILLLVAVAIIVVAIGWEPILLSGLIPIAFAAYGVGFGQFNRGFRYTLSRSADSIRIGAGLTSTRTETIPLGRVHAIEARQPLLWRMFGWWQVRITTAGHSASEGGQAAQRSVVLPVGLVADARAVIRTVFPESASEDDLLNGIDGPAHGYLPAGRRAALVLWFGTRRTGLALLPGEALALRRGALTRTFSLIPVVRMQSIQLRRPLVHRFAGLASLQAHTVLGPVHTEIRGLDLAEAHRVFDHLARTVVRVQAAEREV